LPTYEYACTACGHRLEAVQKFTDDALTVCPECAGALRKVYGAVGIVLKGSGFYKNDSRAGAGKANGDRSSTSDSTPSESKSSDSATTTTDTAKASPGADKATKESTGSKETKVPKESKTPAAAAS
jgi:putative FmdB family regulatory protein